ncbi:MAG: formate/nitrite transporter family protein [Elusimicrobia bacterium]|nr:formate/nitrite transporter family protein [Elusimicrobiota bacterium]
MIGFNSPQETAQKVCETCIGKTKLSWINMMILGILAGAYIGFGAELSTIVSHDTSGYLGIGFSKFLAGSVFSVGLMLVVIGGAELFTGNCLIVLSASTDKTCLRGMFNNWFWVYIANFIGSLLLVWIMFNSGLWKINKMEVGIKALEIANLKVNLPWKEAFFRGIGCNWLVCLAVWLACASRTVTGKIFGIYFPIMAFVASGFEHSVANMYFIPMGIFLKATDAAVKSGLDLTNLTWSGIFIKNLIPVTIGNIAGGAFFVGIFYYFTYMKTK